LYEIAAADFKAYVQHNPNVIDDLATAAAARRAQLDAARASVLADPQSERQSLAKLMRAFFGIE
jgi:hypothetical protein